MSSGIENFPETTQRQRAWAVEQACKSGVDDPLALARKLLWYVLGQEGREPKS